MNENWWAFNDGEGLQTVVVHPRVIHWSGSFLFLYNHRGWAMMTREDYTGRRVCVTVRTKGRTDFVGALVTAHRVTGNSTRGTQKHFVSLEYDDRSKEEGVLLNELEYAWIEERSPFQPPEVRVMLYCLSSGCIAFTRLIPLLFPPSILLHRRRKRGRSRTRTI